MSGADGTYQIIGLPPGEVIVDAYDLDPGTYLYEACNDTTDYLAGTPVPVTLPGVETASINGIVESDDEMPLSGFEVRVFDSDSDALMGAATTAADGRFVIGSLFPGDYRVEVVGTDDYLGEYFGDTTSAGSTQLVTVDFGMDAVGIDFALASATASAAVTTINTLIMMLLEE